MMDQTVLLVDDDTNLLASLRRSLRHERYRILCASSADEALKILYSQPVDLVVSDYQMPGISGIELLARVHREFPDTVRFILTGKATLDLAIRAINEGAISHFFVKPCNVIDLAYAIRQALQQRVLLNHARRLYQRVRRQEAVLEQIERENPGITKVERDYDGAIVVEDPPSEYEAFLAKIRETLGES